MNGWFREVGFGFRKKHVNICGCLRGEKTLSPGGAVVESGDQWARSIKEIEAWGLREEDEGFRLHALKSLF